MSHPNMSSDPTPALTAAELRRRLLASTPPPVGAPESTPAASVASAPIAPEPVPMETMLAAEEEIAPITSAPVQTPVNGHTDLRARLKMPGKSGPVPVTTPRPVPTPAVPALPEPEMVRPPSMRRASSHSNSAIHGALNNLATFDNTQDSFGTDDGSQNEVRRVRLENKELRKLLEEMKQLLQEASESEQQWQAKQKDFDETLAEKDKQIEELSAQLGEIQEKIESGDLAPPPPIPKTRTELEEWSDELEKENAKLQQDRKKCDDERRQLREDEEALEAQMREMEVSMARERALIARQETELRRLSAEIQHELELMQRGDAALREQMSKFQRRAQEVMAKPGGSNNGRR